MGAGNIDFEAIKTHSSHLIASADEAETAAKSLQTLMDGLCQKNDQPSLKKANDTLLETVGAFLRTVRGEMASVNQMTKDAEKLAAASGYN
jgi:hypothetical protein